MRDVELCINIRNKMKKKKRELDNHETKLMFDFLIESDVRQGVHLSGRFSYLWKERMVDVLHLACKWLLRENEEFDFSIIWELEFETSSAQLQSHVHLFAVLLLNKSWEKQWRIMQ